MFCKAWGERDTKNKILSSCCLKKMSSGGEKKVVLSFECLFPPPPPIPLSPELQSYSPFDSYQPYDNTVFHSNVQTLFPLERPTRHNFGLVIKGKLMSPKDFSKHFTPECGILKHSHFP